MFDLADSEIEEGHIVLYFEGTLSPGHAHGCSKATIDLEDGEFVEVVGILRFWEIGVGNDKVIGR